MRTILRVIFSLLLIFSLNCYSKPIEYPEHVDIRTLTTYISNKYKVDKEDIKDVVKTAYFLGDDKTFPTPIDILSIIAIESSFNKFALSRTKDKGVMQVSYKPTSFDILINMQDGVHLLVTYRKSLPKDATIQSYNLGIGRYKEGKRNKTYLSKFNKIKRQLETVIQNKRK